MTRKEHLAWCKTRALEYVERGNAVMAMASFVSDMQKHPDTQDQIMLLLPLATDATARGLVETKDFIEGCN